ncbi:hypothetical protein GQ55_1G166800 [Panicum hallii var. hallii]|uniref:Uncharacterized protein n=1 Tax=Panicum hallii var. hallii TaxID=1504633 RepID=A0A2T7F5Q1_9POAL|nr:hypothetical protein GQ55_1G166800 [Panicum hallii var. hallii]
MSSRVTSFPASWASPSRWTASYPRRRPAERAAVLEAILTSPTADADAKPTITDRPELFRDLVRILRDATSPVAIWCMAAAVQVRGHPARASLVRAEAIPALALAVAAAPTATAELALRLRAEAARCGDGEAAIAAERGRGCGRRDGVDDPVGPSGERRMREAVASAPEALGKLLVMMQGYCAPTTSRMAGELLRAGCGWSRSARAWPPPNPIDRRTGREERFRFSNVLKRSHA